MGGVGAWAPTGGCAARSGGTRASQIRGFRRDTTPQKNTAAVEGCGWPVQEGWQPVAVCTGGGPRAMGGEEGGGSPPRPRWWCGLRAWWGGGGRAVVLVLALWLARTDWGVWGDCCGGKRESGGGGVARGGDGDGATLRGKVCCQALSTGAAASSGWRGRGRGGGEWA